MHWIVSSLRSSHVWLQSRPANNDNHVIKLTLYPSLPELPLSGYIYPQNSNSLSLLLGLSNRNGTFLCVPRTPWTDGTHQKPTFLSPPGPQFKPLSVSPLFVCQENQLQENKSTTFSNLILFFLRNFNSYILPETSTRELMSLSFLLRDHEFGSPCLLWRKCLQAEKELQESKSQVLASKYANIRAMEQRCLVLEQKIAAQNFKILALKSEIESLDDRYCACSRHLR